MVDLDLKTLKKSIKCHAEMYSILGIKAVAIYLLP